MSGSSAIPPIRLTLDGKDAVERGMEDIVRASDRMGQRAQAAAQQMGTLATAAEGTSRAIGLLQTGTSAASMGLSRLGGDFGALAPVVERVGTATAGLVTSFTGGAGLIGALGAVGAAVGAGVLVFQNWNAITSAASSAAESLGVALGLIERRIQTSDTALRGSFAAIQSYADLWARARGEVQAYNRQAAEAFSQGLGRQADELSRENQNAANRALQIERGVAPIEARIAREERVLAGLGPGDVDARLSLEQSIGRLRDQVAEARQQAQNLSDQARVGWQNVTTLRASAASVLRNAEVLFPNQVSGSGDGGGGGGGGGGGRTPVERDPETGYSAAVQARLDRVREAEEREAQRTAEREARELERREDRNNRVTDRIVDYSAERFAELFEKNGRGWEGMLETLERTAKSTIARIAAELVLRPIIAPVVSALGLGALGTGNGGFSGIGGLFGGGSVGTTTDGGAATGGGGLSSLLGLGRSAYSAYGSLSGGQSGGGWLGGLSGYVNNPVFQSGVGWFQPAVGAAAYNALPAGVSGPVLSSGSGSALGGIGGASLGAYAAGIGLGYMGGSMLGGYLARTDAQRTNAQIGAGAGAVSGALAGAAIGSVIPGIGTAIGAVVGGIVGGTGGGGLGGIIGPSSQFAGGDVGIGLGPDGQLRVTGAGGKRWDAGGATEQVQQQLDAINNLLRASGVTVGGMGTGTLGWQGSGQSRNVFGPTEIFNRIRPNLSASNANLESTLRRGVIDSFDELGQVADFITRIYEPLSKARDYTKEYAEAIGSQLSVYDQAIAKARELGLAETGLIAARERAQNDLLRQRNTEVYTQQENLRIAELRLSSSPADQIRADMMEFSLRSGRGDQDLQDFLRASGYGDETDLFQDTLARYRRITRAERLRAREASEERVGASGRSLMEELTVGGLGGLAPNARYAAGLRVLQDARRSGNLDRITAAARSILPQARDFLGTSERYGALVADIGRDVRRLGGDPVGLGVFLEGQAAGNNALERIYGLTNSQLSELQAMNKELARLNAVITTLMQRR
jgi:hypothetical protein